MSNPVRPLNVYLDFAYEPRGKALSQIIGDPVRFVEKPGAADLIVFRDVKSVEENFDRKKLYIYAPTHSAPNYQMPGNVLVIPYALFNLQTFTAALAVVLQSIPQTKPIPVPEEDLATYTGLLSGALSILVVDDNPRHRANAHRTLKGHWIATVPGYRSAMSALATNRFNVVLTDLHLLMCSQTMGEKFELGKEVPYGLLLMVEAARQGVSKVGVVTDMGHHDDPLSAAFDHFGQYLIPMYGSNVRMIHAKVTAEGKDWADALQRIGG